MGVDVRRRIFNLLGFFPFGTLHGPMPFFIMYRKSVWTGFRQKKFGICRWGFGIDAFYVELFTLDIDGNIMAIYTPSSSPVPRLWMSVHIKQRHQRP